MTQLMIALVYCGLALCTLSACSKTANTPASASQATPPESTAKPKVSSQSVVKVTAQPVELPVNGSGEAVVRITIQPGYHINANPPTYAYLKATELELPASEGVSVGFIKYPKPITMKFSFAEKPLDVYEGETELRVLLKAANSSKQGNHSLAGKLRIQACDDQVCYPPGSLEVMIPVKIT